MFNPYFYPDLIIYPVFICLIICPYDPPAGTKIDSNLSKGRNVRFGWNENEMQSIILYIFVRFMGMQIRGPKDPLFDICTKCDFCL